MAKRKNEPIQYALIQYTPDPRRREPRNIGVFTWTPGRLGVLFIDSKRAKKLGADVKTFERWKQYWMRFCGTDGVYDEQDNPVPLTNPESWEIVKRSGRGNYQVVCCGETIYAYSTDIQSHFIEFTKRMFVDLVS